MLSQCEKAILFITIEFLAYLQYYSDMAGGAIMIENFATILSDIMKKSGISAEDLARRTKISPSTISRYLSGEILNPKIDMLMVIADALNTSPSYLIGWDKFGPNDIEEAKRYLERNNSFSHEDFIDTFDNASLIKLANELTRINPIKNQQINELLEEFRQSNDYKTSKVFGTQKRPDSIYLDIPLYNSISCGSGMFVEDNIEEYITLPESLLNSSKEYFCQYADGDSMIGENINPGDLIVFERAQTVENGQIGCFCIDDNIATCKKFYKDDASAIITLQPANNKYSPIIVTVETMNFHIVGKLALVISKRN